MLIEGESGISYQTYVIVWRRDAGLCQHPNCSDDGAEIHHKKFRSELGNHKPENLVLLCTKHHKEAHTEREWREYWRNWNPVDYSESDSAMYKETL